jgi:NADP-dependent 3-hydroxy acid dehydrogenase YdfG
MLLKNKSILLTGGTQGLGKELVNQLCAEGANVILLDIRENNEITNNKQVRFFQVDISDIAQVELLGKKLANEKIDILINDAGIWTTKELEDKDKTKRGTTLNTNLLGVINVTDVFLPNLHKSKIPQIIFINSIAAALGFGGEGVDWPTYNASKWGVRGYMMALRDNSKLKRIKIGAIYPGGFESNIYENAGDGPEEEYHNQPWMMQTKTVANAVMFMLNQPADANVAELILTKHFDS